ncbi:MAG TPA: response regulator [Firmicutes bacterium]|nr:response regulator [Bacillota bacterium]
MSKAILIADDEKNIRVTLVQCLEGAGYSADSAVDGEHALEKLSRQDYDVVLLDMKMPGMDGIETLRRIKQMKPDQPVIMITAYGTIETAVEAMKLGAVDYLQKPFTPEEILGLVRKVLERPKGLSASHDKLDWPQLVEQAKAYIVQRKFHKAGEALKAAVASKPLSPEPYNLYGVLLESLGEIDDARKLYRAALAIDPSYGPANANLERVCKLKYSPVGIDLGDKREEQTEGGQTCSGR